MNTQIQSLQRTASELLPNYFNTPRAINDVINIENYAQELKLIQLTQVVRHTRKITKSNRSKPWDIKYIFFNEKVATSNTAGVYFMTLHNKVRYIGSTSNIGKKLKDFLVSRNLFCGNIKNTYTQIKIELLKEADLGVPYTIWFYPTADGQEQKFEQLFHLLMKAAGGLPVCNVKCG